MNNLMTIERGNLVKYKEGLVAEQEAAVRIAEEIIKVAQERNIPAPKESHKTILLGNARLKALNAGFLPTAGLRTAVIPSLPLRKKKDEYDWTHRNKMRILSVVAALPPQIHEAISEAKSLDIFDKLSISQPGGDPVIVGHAGGWKFLIASWVNLMDGQGVGFRSSAAWWPK